MSDLVKIEILKKLATEEVSPSIPELAVYTERSVGGIHNELQELVSKGLVVPPPKRHQARGYRISPMGRNWLVANGYMPYPKVFGGTR